MFAAWEKEGKNQNKNTHTQTHAKKEDGSSSSFSVSVPVLHDVKQLTLSVITKASFGLNITANYGGRKDQVKDQERKAHKHTHTCASGNVSTSTHTHAPSSSSSGLPPHTHTRAHTRTPSDPLSKYHLPFSQCVEMVLSNTILKVLLPKWAFRYE
jgi:hypothetical protein